MHYLSTRGEAPVLGFTDALLAGLAGDGGLYVPESYPALTPAEMAAFAGTPYAEVAERVIAPFVGGDFAAADLRAMIAAAYREFGIRPSPRWFSSTPTCSSWSCFTDRLSRSRTWRCNFSAA